jgi:Tol biopolymer transport system component
LSPDGKRVALVIGPALDTELWIYDLGGRPPFPLVTGRRAGNHAWSADGKQIAFLGGPSSAEFGIYVIPADGGTPDPKLLRAGSALFPEVWKADDEMLLVSGGVAELDILAAPATSQGQPRPVVASPESQEFHPALSPDGRWLAYVSNRSGRFEIWVKKYPDGTPVRVSEDGGLEPKWAADGRELFYRLGSAMMAIAVATEVDLSVGQTVELFDDASYLAMPIPFVRLYDVAPDGRFLMIRQLRANEPDEKSPFGSIVVVQNWFEELKRLVPTE